MCSEFHLVRSLCEKSKGGGGGAKIGETHMRWLIIRKVLYAFVFCRDAISD